MLAGYEVTPVKTWGSGGPALLQGSASPFLLTDPSPSPAENSDLREKVAHLESLVVDLEKRLSMVEVVSVVHSP